LSTSEGSAGRKSVPHDRVIGQAFLDCDFGVAFGKQGLEKRRRQALIGLELSALIVIMVSLCFMNSFRGR
jgi:hypothetical protein